MDGLIRINPNEIKKPKWRIHFDDIKKFAAVKASVEKYGQLTPIHVYKDKEGNWFVLDGRQVLTVMQENNQEVTAIEHNVNEVQAQLISLSLNFTSGTMDEVDVAEIIHKLLETYKPEQLANWSPFKLKTVQHYQKLFDFVWEEFINKPEENGQIGMF